MTVRARQTFLAALFALGALAAGPAGVAQAHTALTQAPSPVTTSSAVLHGLVNPQGHKTTYWFEVGTTTAYGTATNPASAGKGTAAVVVNHGMGGLQPGTTYHVRVIASDDEGLDYGGDVTFTTLPNAGAIHTPVTAVPTPAALAPLPGTQAAPAPVAAPKLATTVALAPEEGSVFVRVPGATRPAALGQGATVPVGSIVDTRGGTVALQTALPGGTTQTGSFHGGVFQVRQPAGGHGLTELVLRGALPTCPAAGARAASVIKRRPPRSLWGHDHHGRFRTRGSNSVITVRGTTWFVSDRCDGTLTRVMSGSVAVRDLHTGRTVVVRAGHSQLARKAR